MILNRENILSVADAMFTSWDDALQAADVSYEEFVSVIDAPDVEAMSYNWLDDLGFPRQWIGERVLNSLQGQTLKITNLPFEETMSPLKTEDIRRDTYGQYTRKVQGLAKKIRSGLPRQLVDLVEANMYTTVGYDGQYIIDSDHVINGVTYSNLVSGALSYDNVYAAIQKMEELRTPDGQQPLRITPTVLVVGPSNRKTAEAILEDDWVGAANKTQKNLLKGRLKLKINYEFVGAKAGYWQVQGVAPDGFLKPVALQRETRPKLTTTAFQVAGEFGLTAEPEAQFMRRDILFGTEWWGNAAPTLWQLVVGSVG